MTAPSAPHIVAHGNGSGDRVLVRWLPVPNATDYNLYVTEEGARGVEDSIADDEIGTDGWMRAYTHPLVGPITVDVTSLNSIAEESSASNTVQVILKGSADVRRDYTGAPHSLR
jgi:hypothetical protein